MKLLLTRDAVVVGFFIYLSSKRDLLCIVL